MSLALTQTVTGHRIVDKSVHIITEKKNFHPSLHAAYVQGPHICKGNVSTTLHTEHAYNATDPFFQNKNAEDIT
jgi:hypothetical protein|tara:strand:- start:1306 stop:1527 length:222 start_codon:yes stop_codon:yes gene_type:complete